MEEAHYLTIEKSARYYLNGPVDGDYHTICFALHGYGQLGKYFIQNFMELNKMGILCIAPEGFHRFYLSNKRRVGASWMTKEDRLRDITDYCQYLDQVYHHFQVQIANANRVGILGFSQGVATACRWLSNSREQFDFLINWAGVFPPGLNIEQSLHRMRHLPVHLLLGDDDEYISQADFKGHLQYLKQQGFEVKSEIFEGEHKIYPEPLKQVFSDINHE